MPIQPWVRLGWFETEEGMLWFCNEDDCSCFSLLVSTFVELCYRRMADLLRLCDMAGSLEGKAPLPALRRGL